MKNTFSRQLSISIAALVLFLLPLLYAGHSEEITEDELATSLPLDDYEFASEAEKMNIYSPDDFAINVIVSSLEDLGYSLYSDNRYRNSVIEYYEELTGSRDIAENLLEKASKQGVSFSLAASLMWAESGFNPMAYYNNYGSIDRGLFQLNSASFPELSKDDFYDIETNISKGIGHLAYCLRTGENEIVALAVYNAGHGRVKGGGTPLMSLDHISKILTYRNELERDFERYISRKGKIKVFKKTDKNLLPAVDRKKSPK